MINFEKEGKVDVITFSVDKINALITEDIRSEISKLFENPNSRVAIDLSGVHYIDSSGFGCFLSILTKICSKLTLSFPPETATAILSSNLNILYSETVALALSSTDFEKHFLHSLSPEYGLKKNASLFLQAVHNAAVNFIEASHYNAVFMNY